jgi:hypothetical protein
MLVGAAIAFAAIIPALVSPLRSLRSMPETATPESDVVSPASAKAV